MIASPLILSALECGGEIVLDHPLMKRLADERRISPLTMLVFDIQPSGNGWKYPVPGGGYRWKNADSTSDPKYKWPDGKPEGAIFYHAQDLATEIKQAGGACWYVSGEADVQAMYSAGIRHVMSGFSESKVPDNLAEYLIGLGASLVYIAPDLDPTGATWAQKVARALQNSPLELEAHNLPEELGARGDLGKAWKAYNRPQSFERWLTGLPRFFPEPLPQPQPAARLEAQADHSASIPQEYKDLVADRLFATEYQGDGFTAKNVHCPFHHDETPDASLHHEKGLYCHACGRWYTWNETGIKLGVGSLKAWLGANSLAISTILREKLISKGHLSLARLLDVFALAGWQPGREFTRKDALTVAKDLLKPKTIRTATEQLVTYCPFFTPLTLAVKKNRGEKKGKKSCRPENIYKLPALNDIADKLGVIQMHFDVMPPEKIKRAADYRAEVYAAYPRRKPGIYARKKLADRIGVSAQTSRKYDKLAGLKVTPNTSRHEMTPQELDDLPEILPKKRKRHIWLEDERGNKYPPLKKALAMIAQRGGGQVYRVRQLANTYGPGDAAAVTIESVTPQAGGEVES